MMWQLQCSGAGHVIFNSLPFLFAFLPIALIAYYLICCLAPELRRYFLIMVTILFYSFGGLGYTVLLIVSVGTNYAIARFIMGRRQSRAADLALVVAILANLMLLGIFKYTAPIIDAYNSFAITDIDYLRLVLPIGISFFTFQQIGLLVDLNRRRFEVNNWREYSNFVLFFPTLLAGPITRFEEMAPQLASRPPPGLALRNIYIGLAIFAIGLVKKSMLADSLGLYASPVFDGAAQGQYPGLFDAWLAAFAYTAQIYFDFAGYSDMAIGVARMFGIVLPANFHSPLRSKSIPDVWRRWHITLGRWVQSYVFQPLAVVTARRAAQRRLGKWGMFGIGFALPTTVAMVTIGVWHGAGGTFVFFGLLQSFFMIVAEWWRMGRKKRKKAGWDIAAYAWWPTFSLLLTIVCFVVSVVAFRAVDMSVMFRLYASMVGMNGLTGTAISGDVWPMGLSGALLTTAICWAVILFPPNTQQFMTRYSPVLEWSNWANTEPPVLSMKWSMSSTWAIATGALLFLGFIFMMRGTTQFIYFNF